MKVFLTRKERKLLYAKTLARNKKCYTQDAYFIIDNANRKYMRRHPKPCRDNDLFAKEYLPTWYASMHKNWRSKVNQWAYGKNIVTITIRTRNGDAYEEKTVCRYKSREILFNEHDVVDLKNTHLLKTLNSRVKHYREEWKPLHKRTFVCCKAYVNGILVKIVL